MQLRLKLKQRVASLRKRPASKLQAGRAKARPATGSDMNAKYALLLLAAFMLSGCAATQVEHEPNYGINVEIDEGLWTNAADIRWPSEEKDVWFFFNKHASRHPCLRENADFVRDVFLGEALKSLRLGEKCGALIVLYRDDEFTKSSGITALRFVANHEAFHLAAQMYGMRVPIEYLDNRGYKPEAASKFFRDLTVLFGANYQYEPSKDQICSFLEAELLALPRADRLYANKTAYWEWPAEYYSYSYLNARGQLDWGKYRRIRSSLGDYLEYAPGIPMGRMLDKLIGRAAWQDQLSAGSSMLDIACSVCFEGYKPDNGVLVQVRRMHLMGGEDSLD